METLSVALWTTNLEPPAPACSCCRSSPAWLTSIAGRRWKACSRCRSATAWRSCSAPCRLHIRAGAGTVGHLNLAWLLLPHGRTFAQDNICLAPSAFPT